MRWPDSLAIFMAVFLPESGRARNHKEDPHLGPVMIPDFFKKSYKVSAFGDCKFFFEKTQEAHKNPGMSTKIAITKKTLLM